MNGWKCIVMCYCDEFNGMGLMEWSCDRCEIVDRQRDRDELGYGL